MGYSETYCQLCGVSFAIARIRTPQEPIEAAWAYYGPGFVDCEEADIKNTCGKSSGCQTLRRKGLLGGDEPGTEHLAGPGCVCREGYSGYQISVEEMKGCRAVQSLLTKDESWVPEPDDQDFELESNYFLTGVGDGSPDEAPLEDISPVRHGVDSIFISNEMYEGDCGLPFHPTCFNMYKIMSKARFDKVDVHGLWQSRALEGEYEDFDKMFPRDFAVRNAREQSWQHDRGSEYLVANPVDIPGLPMLLKNLDCKGQSHFNVNKGIYTWSYTKGSDSYRRRHSTPPPAPESSDPFLKLPAELLYMVLGSLTSKELTSLRSATRACMQLPIILFRQRVFADFPWLWEAREMDAASTDWWTLYEMAKGVWSNIKGFQNRKRIWKDITEILNRIESYRAEGKIMDE